MKKGKMDPIMGQDPSELVAVDVSHRTDSLGGPAHGCCGRRIIYETRIFARERIYGGHNQA